MIKNKWKTQWNLAGLFYKSLDDPQIEKDITEMEELVAKKTK